jgi:hypothetical protein
MITGSMFSMKSGINGCTAEEARRTQIMTPIMVNISEVAIQLVAERNARTPRSVPRGTGVNFSWTKKRTMTPALPSNAAETAKVGR